MAQLCNLALVAMHCPVVDGCRNHVQWLGEERSHSQATILLQLLLKQRQERNDRTANYSHSITLPMDTLSLTFSGELSLQREGIERHLG